MGTRFVGRAVFTVGVVLILGLVVASVGCQPGGLFGPKSTPTPDAAAALQALAGIWQSPTQAYDALHIEPDGTYIRYDLYRIRNYTIFLGGKLSFEEGLWTIVDSSGRDPCPSDEVGLYEIAEGSDGTIEFKPIDDPCTTRAFVHKQSGAYYRATKAMNLIGTWTSQTSAYTLIFSRDHEYRLHKTSEEPIKETVERGEWAVMGTGDWDFEMMSRRCGPLRTSSTTYGGYDLTMAEDGTLSFGYHNDTCDVRRDYLEAHGPYHRTPEIEALAGRWTDKTSGQYLLEIYRDATYAMYDAENVAQGALEEGRIWHMGDRIRIDDTGGQQACPEDKPGFYEMRLDGDNLEIAAATDPCERRADFFKTYHAWERAAP